MSEILSEEDIKDPERYYSLKESMEVKTILSEKRYEMFTID